MNEPISDEEQALIQKLIETENTYWQLIFKLQKLSENPVATVEHLQWKHPSTWDFIERLNIKQQQTLFFHMLDTTVDINHPCRKRAFTAIYQLPRQWVLENLEETIKPLFEQYDEETYQTIIELYAVLDTSKAREWATKATQHANPHIQETGQDWLDAQK